mmetsp:Transcript_14612/g.42893  ORF Transcript_14612/g.42893 Transcript_14612/m.42893 type:complete len:363 (-) Transcript_14612:633-1721(-)
MATTNPASSSSRHSRCWTGRMGTAKTRTWTMTKRRTTKGRRTTTRPGRRKTTRKTPGRRATTMAARMTGKRTRTERRMRRDSTRRMAISTTWQTGTGSKRKRTGRRMATRTGRRTARRRTMTTRATARTTRRTRTSRGPSGLGSRLPGCIHEDVAQGTPKLFTHLPAWRLPHPLEGACCKCARRPRPVREARNTLHAGRHAEGHTGSAPTRSRCRLPSSSKAPHAAPPAGNGARARGCGLPSSSGSPHSGSRGPRHQLALPLACYACDRDAGGIALRLPVVYTGTLLIQCPVTAHARHRLPTRTGAGGRMQRMAGGRRPPGAVADSRACAEVSKAIPRDLPGCPHTCMRAVMFQLDDAVSAW